METKTIKLKDAPAGRAQTRFPAESSRYVVTKWTEGYDREGLLNDFKVLDEFEREEEAVVLAFREAEESAGGAGAVECRDVPARPNRSNRVVFSRQAYLLVERESLCLRVFLDVVAVPRSVELDGRLFDTSECGREVEGYFAGRGG